MSEVKPLSFHIEEGFTFLIGKEQKEIKVVSTSELLFALGQ